MNARRGALFAFLAAGLCAETLRFRAEWRGVDAGAATLETAAGGNGLTLVTAGFARMLYPVNDRYTVAFDGRGCAESSLMKIDEGRTRAEVSIHYGSAVKVLLRDLRNHREETRAFDGDGCTYDILAALSRLRAQRLEPGRSTEFAIANDRKFARVRVEALGREAVRMGAGMRPAIRHEVHMMNGLLYRRKGRLFLWLADDETRLPLRIRVQMPFYLGTVSLELENQP